MIQAQFDKHFQYMQEITPRLIEAEQTIKEIKQSAQYKRASNYFKVLYHRGLLKENPCSKNGYRIERVEAVNLSDIMDILTPEQMEQIKSRMKGH